MSAPNNTVPAVDPPTKTETEVQKTLAQTTGLESKLAPETKATPAPAVKTEPTSVPIPEIEATKTTPQDLAPGEKKPTKTPYDMLAAVKSLTLAPQRRPEINTFVPSAHQMFRILHYMDEALASNAEVNGYVPEYHPLVHRLYYSMVFVIQTLRCMDHAGIVPHFSYSTVKKILDAFPPESLPIAGPLICFFQSLSISQPDDARFSLVVPCVPLIYGAATRHNSLVPQDPSSYLFPQPHILRALIAELARTDINTLEDGYRPVMNFDDPDFPVQGINYLGTLFRDDSPAALKRTLNFAGNQYPIECCPEDTIDYVTTIPNLDIPDCPVNSDTRLYRTLLGLDDPSWLRFLAKTVATLNKFFRHSGTLAHCSVIGNGSTTITHTVGPNCFPNVLGLEPNGMYSPNVLADFSPTSTTPEPSIPDLTQKYAFLSQVNLTVPANGPPPYATFNADDQHGRSGPYWYQTTPMHQSGRNVYDKLLQKEVIKNFYDSDPTF